MNHVLGSVFSKSLGVSTLNSPVLSENPSLASLLECCHLFRLCQKWEAH